MSTPEILKALGPLAELYRDNSVSEIMVDKPDQILIERAGELHDAGVKFASPEALRQVILDLMAACGAVLKEGETLGEMRFPAGEARALAVLPPTAIYGPHLVIRKLIHPNPITWEMILQYRCASQELYDLFYKAVRVPVNILISGGTGSGKTTLLNRFAELIPDEQRLIVAEGMHEIQVRHPRTLYLEAFEALSMDDVLVTASKMRPDWLIVGELLGGEALRAIKIISNGHAAMTGLHANNVEDALRRLEALCLMANLGLSLEEIRPLIADSFQLLVSQHKLPHGPRRITQVSELCGYEDGRYLIQALYRYNPENDCIESTGIRPTWE